MKITVQDGNYFYIADFTVNDKIDGGFVEEYYAEPDEVISAVIHLLGCAYGASKIQKALMKEFGQQQE